MNKVDLVRPLNDRNSLYTIASMLFGREAQIMMAMEELSELQVQLAKLLGSRIRNLDDLYSEIADAEIMLEQLRLMFSGSHIDVMKEKKLSRLEHILMDMAEVEAGGKDEMEEMDFGSETSSVLRRADSPETPPIY